MDKWLQMSFKKWIGSHRALNALKKMCLLGLFLPLLLSMLISMTACSSSKPLRRAPVVNLSRNTQNHDRYAHVNARPTGKNLGNRASNHFAHKKGYYIVQNGDTLFSIAKQSGKDPQHLAILNGIHPPYKIVSGQKLVFSDKVKPRDSSTRAKLEPKTSIANNQATHHKIESKNKKPMNKTLAQKPLASTRVSTQLNVQDNAQFSGKIQNNIHWRWPVKGKIIRYFQASGKGKGIDIAGTLGRPIKAAAAGVVVYSGNGLKGYGNLIIIKHNEDFLSAYAHNRELMVKEGEEVNLGKEIALMGQTDTEQVKVHFEIRYRGKPVDPLRFLPKP